VYGEKTLISDISFDLNEGDCLVLVGKSGSGSVCSSHVRVHLKFEKCSKSTLLKCLAHLNVYKGDVLFRGK
jgi:ABC-type cobalamin/Fe3+-siderophores transport system ATPase subunit